MTFQGSGRRAGRGYLLLEQSKYRAGQTTLSTWAWEHSPLSSAVTGGRCLVELSLSSRRMEVMVSSRSEVTAAGRRTGSHSGTEQEACCRSFRASHPGRQWRSKGRGCRTKESAIITCAEDYSTPKENRRPNGERERACWTETPFTEGQPRRLTGSPALCCTASTGDASNLRRASQ